WRWSRRSLALAVAVVAAFIVSFLTLDLGRISIGGQSLKTLAETYGSRYLERPLSIGSIRALMAPGWYELHDVVIAGRNPGDAPFLRASRISVHVEWRALLRNEVVVEVRMKDWEMVIERFADGTHNMPRFTPRNPSTGPKRFTTTVNFVYADDGAFRYQDHGVPWSVNAPNLTFNLVRARNLAAYVGTAKFSGGTVAIQRFLPMSAGMTTRFALDGPRVQLNHIDLVTDGAMTHVNGHVDFSKPGPEMTYNVHSTLDFNRMRELFFADASWDVSGAGSFDGVFKLFKNGRDLTGQFRSDEARLRVSGVEYTFPHMHGALRWLPDRFTVSHADMDFEGGSTRLSYSLAPLGTPGGAIADFDVDYRDVSLAGVSDLYDLAGLELDGRATGHLQMTWPNGRFRGNMRGRGNMVVAPPPGVALTPAALPEVAVVVPPMAGFSATAPVGRFAAGGELNYRFEPGELILDSSWVATPASYISFSGRTDYGEQTEIPFHVTSLDWQESDRLLVGIMRAFGRSTNAVDVGGRGVFDGTLTKSFRAPLVKGRFKADHMRAWDVTWGPAVGDLVIQDNYLDIANGVIGADPGAQIRADGRFALGFPRADGGEEINARVVVSGWPLADLRHAFGLDDWPMEGVVGLADLRLEGKYTGPHGDGEMRIEQGRAWGESFERATGSLTFEGTGLRISGIDMNKSTGRVRGSAWIGWDNRYAFDAESAVPIPVESLEAFAVEGAPFTGQLVFKASGASTFDSPRYEFTGTIADMAIGDEGIGPVTGLLSVADEVLAIEAHVSSTRLAIDGNGTIALNDASDARLSFRFLNTSIDPYLKFAGPEVSPYARIVASGRLDIEGSLADTSRLKVETTIDGSTVSLPDYDLTNDGPIRLRYENRAFVIERLKLAGPNTTLDVSGAVDTAGETINLAADGQANLAILQLFFSNLSTSGAAAVQARLNGPLASPQLTGQATITGGNIRHFSLPHSLTAINGVIRFDATGIDVSGLRGRMGNGDVAFGGRITLAGGYRPDEFNLTAHGESMRLRYPEGFTSTVNADLALTGQVRTPTLSGTVDVISVNYRPPVDQGTGILGLAGGAVGSPVATTAAAEETGFPLVFDIRIQVPSLPLIQTRAATVLGSANLQFTGTYDRPSLTGRVDIEGGEMSFLGNRYSIRPGYVEFNEGSFDPVFDVEAVTRPRTVGQTIDVTVRATGTFDRITPQITSDPSLPETDIVTLLLGGTADIGTAERARLSPAENQQRMMQTFGAMLVTSPITDRVGNAVEQALPIETVQITPLIGDSLSLQRLSPAARITLGTRISSKVFLTYSRVLNASQEEIILLEYEQSNRISWVLSRNEDRTFALDFRLRYVF
ncbi:MAG TPA: translocation/assembly module TamB domain-containing protein, partial [Vicinamibacterales bacterium]|nr:translocation/assembly module TamB domain-containing protein [Vicinamibacterales bacterium]